MLSNVPLKLLFFIIFRKQELQVKEYGSATHGNSDLICEC